MAYFTNNSTADYPFATTYKKMSSKNFPYPYPAKMSPSLRDQLLQTAHDYLAAHNNRDLDGMRALCNKIFMHRSGPPTVKSPDRNNDK
jgi:hypothetical protein